MSFLRKRSFSYNDTSDDLVAFGTHPIEQEVHGEHEPTIKRRRSKSFVNENTNPAEAE